MQSAQFRVIKPFLILIWLLTSFAVAQNLNERLIQLYRNHDLNGLKKELQPSAVKQNPLTAEFFKAVFLDDGEAAKEIYQHIYDRGYGKIKFLAAEKLQQYYYARGYYITANKYQKYLVENQPPTKAEEVDQPLTVRNQTRNSAFYIQVGAFGMKENAEQRRKFLKLQDISSQVIKRTINGKQFFCVWISGRDDLEKTLNYAEQLKHKFDLEYQIMKK